MPGILIVIAVIIIIIAIPTYPKWSYKKWLERCEEETKRRNSEENDI